MTSSRLLVAEAASLRLPPDVLLLHVVELAATYLAHSTLFLATGWALLSVVALLTRRRQPKSDGPADSSRAVSPALTEVIWKLSAVLALVTVPLSVFTGWSRPAWEWSLRERPSRVIAVGSPNAARPEPTLMTEPLAPAAVTSRPALPEELAVLDNDLAADRPMADRPMADEPTARLFHVQSETESAVNVLGQRIEGDEIVIAPTAIVGLPRPIEASAESSRAQRDAPPVSLPSRVAEVEPRQSAVHWLGVAIVLWVVLSALRLLVKGVALRRRLAGCEPILGTLRHELNRLAPRGRTVRLLRSVPLSSGLAGERAGVRGPNGVDATNTSDGSMHSLLDRPPHGDAAKTEKEEEPLTLTLSPPERGARGQDTITEPMIAITEPFACGVLRWTIVLPAGIERKLSPVELKALLAHEVAHLVRRDPWWLWLGEVICSCLAFQPLNFLARRRWQQAAELLCDDWAVERKVEATSLASCLTRIAEWRLDRRAAVMGLTAVGSSGSLTQRIQWLLRTGRAAEPKRPRGRMLATLLTFAAGLLVGTYGPRLSFVLPAAANDDPEAVVVSNESELWNAIERDLAETLSALARLDRQLASDPDPEVASLANNLRQRMASLRQRLNR